MNSSMISGRRLDEIRHAADAETGQPTKFHGEFRHLHHDRDAVDHRRAVDGVVAQRRKQQHRNAAAGDQHIDALGHQRPRLFGEQFRDLARQRLRFVGLQYLSRLERHRMGAGNPALQPVFGDLVMEPGNVARIDRDDAAALAELAAMEHRRFAERQNRNIDDRARFIEAGILEVADHEGIVALPLGPHRVADHFAGAAEFDDGMGIGIVRRNALDVDRRAGIDDFIEMLAQAIPIDLAVLVIDVALVPDADRLHGKILLRARPADGAAL